MKAQNILLFTLMTLMSTTYAASSTSNSGTSTASMPSLESGSSSTKSSSKSSSNSSSKTSNSGSSKTSSDSSSITSSSGSLSSMSSSASNSTNTMPKISTTSSASSGGNSTSSSYLQTFTPTVPTAANPEIYIPTLPSGTTFIAVGGALGLLFFSLMFTRLIMWCLSSKNAKKANQMNKVTEFDYDPSLFQDKDLKNTSRSSIYSLGSTSTLNVLGSQASMEQMLAPSGRSFRTALMNNNPRNSLFISPTEMLANQQLNNLQRLEEVGGGGYNSYDSPIESPYASSFGQNASGSIDTRPIEPKSKSRPPSVYMDQLFDDELSIQDNEGQYDANAHNRV